MNQSIELRSLNGRIRVPASKSMTQRVYAAALLQRGTTRIFNYGVSEDELAALSVIRQLGAVVTSHEDHLLISSGGIIRATAMADCGESGLAARLFTPIIALSDQPIMISGRGSLLQRPMDLFGTVLPQLGVTLTGFNGHIPFTVTGPLQARSLQVDGSMSSQFSSGLLFALAHAAKEPVTLRVNQLSSTPYIDLSLDILQRFGRKISHDQYRDFLIDPSAFVPEEQVSVTVEADWSSAAFWIAAATINGNIILEGLQQHSLQADRALLDIVTGCGAVCSWENGQLHIRNSSLHAFDYDATHSPDLFPVLAILAACCRGQSRIKGLQRLLHKESNRAASISGMLDQLGIVHHSADDALFVEGREAFRACTINSCHDHRIVMAAALASLRCTGPVVIEHAESVAKSYPGFFSDLSPFL